MQDGFILERIAADHVHVDVGAQPRPDIGMAAEIRHGAFHLWPPHEAQSALGTRQRPNVDQPREHASRLQNGHASASVVVSAGPLMVQMAAVNYFAAGRVRPGDNGGHDRPVSGADFGFHPGVKNDLISGSQTCSQ
jgi:hypothetical protein